MSLAAGLSLWAAATLAAAFYTAWHGQGGRRLAIALGVFACFLAVEVLAAARGFSERVGALFPRRAAWLLAFLPLLAYLIYALGTNSFALWRAGIAAAFTLAPPVLLASAGEKMPGVWQDYAAALALWLPVKFRWLYYLWPYPSERLSYVFTVLLALNVGIIGFLFVRRLDGVGYTVGWGRRWGLTIVLNFAIFAAIAIPLGQAVGFIGLNPLWLEWKMLPLTVLSIFFFTAWPEEFLFRGVLQNLLSRTLGSAELGWLAAAVVFGLAHITNYGQFPNWRYVLLATMAGIFYGRAWRRTGSIFASTLVHTAVNTAWHLLFRTF